MTLFWKTLGLAMMALLLALVVGKREKDFGLLLTLAACCALAAAAAEYLEPVVDFFRELEDTAGLSPELLGQLLKALGIGLVVELAGAVCADAGNGALAKQLQILGNAAIAYLSLPILSGLLILIREILGEL